MNEPGGMIALRVFGSASGFQGPCLPKELGCEKLLVNTKLGRQDDDSLEATASGPQCRVGVLASVGRDAARWGAGCASGCEGGASQSRRYPAPLVRMSRVRGRSFPCEVRVRVARDRGVGGSGWSDSLPLVGTTDPDLGARSLDGLMLPNKPLQQPNATRVRSKVRSCRDAAGCARGSSRPWYVRRRPWRSLLNGRSLDTCEWRCVLKTSFSWGQR